MLNVFETRGFRPVTSVNARHQDVKLVNSEVFVDDGKKLGFSCGRHVNDLGGIEDFDLVAGSGIGLGICKLT